MSIRITGTGSYIPKSIEKNEDFHQHEFLNVDGSRIDYPNEVIVEKFKAITGIVERRYADPNLVASDLGFLAAQKAIEDANLDQHSVFCPHVSVKICSGGGITYSQIKDDMHEHSARKLWCPHLGMAVEQVREALFSYQTDLFKCGKVSGSWESLVFLPTGRNWQL